MWYKAYGWKENPFSIRPVPVLVGLDQVQEKVLDQVLSGSLALVLGETGVGKTSLLLWLGKELRMHRMNPIYVNLHSVSPPQARAVEQELQNHRTPFQRLFRRFPRNVVLLLDEAQELDLDAAQMIKVHFDSSRLASAVFAGCDEPKLPVPLNSRIGPNRCQLGKLPPVQLITLIKHRTKGHYPFTNDEVIELLVRCSDGSPRSVLQLCEYVCINFRAKAELGESITAADVEALLNAVPVSFAAGVASRRAEPAERAEPARLASLPRLSELHRLSEPSEQAERAMSAELLSKLSPLQRGILEVLVEEPKTVAELSKRLGSTQDSIRKRLSQLRNFGEGIGPLIEVISDRPPKRYSLTPQAREMMKDSS
jgi:DNA-binding MarR family transcriptional regulator